MIDACFFFAYVKCMKTLSSQLRDAIRNCGMSHRELAANVDISDAILSRFMRAERSMNLETAEKLCAYLGLELREVVKRGRK